MGLLDDAIKEHLELKRRRGADAEEVSRLEQEALGPSQRGEFAGATAPAEPASADEVADAPLPAEEPPPPPPLPAAEPAPETAEHDVAEEPDPRDQAEPGWLEDENEPLVEPLEVEEPLVPGQATVEYTPPAEPAERDDVLEETPDFLQETPEHDRLWFEQKPPRDFDLDR